jgi:DNA repair/transcription protein MET18/MMS19
MGNDFLAKYIALAEGEKDPRNLLVAFAIARVILIEFETSSFVEVRIPMTIHGVGFLIDCQ